MTTSMKIGALASAALFAVAGTIQFMRGMHVPITLLDKEELAAIVGDGKYPCVYAGFCTDASLIQDLCIHCNLMDSWRHCCKASPSSSSNCGTPNEPESACEEDVSIIALAGPGTPGDCASPCSTVGPLTVGPTCPRNHATGTNCPL